MGERYFPVIAAHGLLNFLWGGAAPWEAKELYYQDETIIDHILASARTGRLHRWREEVVKTAEELLRVLELSERSESHIRIWIHEGLEELVMQLMD
ncbi:MAG TPA: hypothetical protein VJA65_09000 [bacterium]|nr:hypothetical protein [bacterium]